MGGVKKMKKADGVNIPMMTLLQETKPALISSGLKIKV